MCVLLRGSYHGGSPQTMGLTSNSAYKYPIASGIGCHNASLCWETLAYRFFFLSLRVSSLKFMVLLSPDRPCVLMCLEGRGEEVTAEIPQYRLAENVTAPKVHTLYDVTLNDTCTPVLHVLTPTCSQTYTPMQTGQCLTSLRGFHIIFLVKL